MKKITSPADLSINGAEPSFRELLHVGEPHTGDREQFKRYIDEIFDRNWLTNDGVLSKELEKKVADYHRVEHCVALCNGTIALEIAIRALGLEGEVIVPSYTFIATAHSLHWQGLKPVFADIKRSDHTIDPDSVSKLITPETSGIIGVHLWGNVCAVNELRELAGKHKLKLMFDAAHAFGCEYDGVKVGNFGECEVLSFHATKFFNTFEGGAILTNDAELAEKAKLMRNFGFDGLDSVIYPGTNGKMSEVCAAMGLVNLDSINEIITANRHRYTRYKDGFAALDNVRLLKADEATGAANYQYIVVELQEGFPVDRDRMLDILLGENVRARRYFWPGCHRMSPYREDQDAVEVRHLAVTEEVAKQVIVLPNGNRVDDSAVDQILSVFRVVSESDGMSDANAKGSRA